MSDITGRVRAYEKAHIYVTLGDPRAKQGARSEWNEIIPKKLLCDVKLLKTMIATKIIGSLDSARMGFPSAIRQLGRRLRLHCKGQEITGQSTIGLTPDLTGYCTAEYLAMFGLEYLCEMGPRTPIHVQVLHRWGEIEAEAACFDGQLLKAASSPIPIIYATSVSLVMRNSDLSLVVG